MPETGIRLRRPSVPYRPDFCDDLIEHLSHGRSVSTFAGVIGVPRQTLYVWTKEHAEFGEAMSIGLLKSLFWWEERGREAVSGDAPKNFQAAVYIFTMKNRFGWRDAYEARIIEDGNFETTEVTHEMLMKYIEAN